MNSELQNGIGFGASIIGVLLAIWSLRVTYLTLDNTSDIKRSYQRKLEIPNLLSEVKNEAKILQSSIEKGDLNLARASVEKSKDIIKRVIDLQPSDITLLRDCLKNMNKMKNINTNQDFWDCLTQIFRAVSSMERTNQSRKWE